MKTILAADIGATNGRFGLFVQDGPDLALERSVWLKSREARSLDHLLDRAIDSGLPGPDRCDISVLAVCGPVTGGRRSRLSNLAWDIDLDALPDRFGPGKMLLINDFVAQAYGCRTRAVDNARVVQHGQIDRNRPLVVVGAGTGLGHCGLVPDRTGGYVAVPSEGGHAALQMRGPAEEEFARFALERTGAPYVFNELAVSGSGLSLIHEFLTGDQLEPHEAARLLGPQSETAAWFARFYGRACRNYALTVLALGGVYLTGGVTAKNPILAEHPEFLREFTLSPAHSELLAGLPVHLNVNEEMGLFGAALCGRFALGTSPATD